MTDKETLSETLEDSKASLQTPLEEKGTLLQTADAEQTDSASEEEVLPLPQENSFEEDLPKEVPPEKDSSESEPSDSLQFEAFQEKMTACDCPEKKLQLCIDFMRSALNRNGAPDFKYFWEVRKNCLPLFKESINPSARIHLWAEYSELSKEARHLKEILDEQSAFAIEQIDIAIKSLESDIEHMEEQSKKMPNIDLPSKSLTLEPSFPFYNQIQRELNLLNTYAGRINALRKELIRTEMRIRQKNVFFQRLSTAGDRVFPKRKDYIKQISQQFMENVNSFISKNFSSGEIQGSLFTFREEIKALQSIAKVLTLNTHSFTHTRTKLSECWDKVKRLEKERKKERAQKRVIYKKSVEEVEEKIKAYEELSEKETLSNSEALQQLNQVFSHMKTLELGREEFHSLKEKISTLKKQITDKEKIIEQERLKKEKEKERLKQEQFVELRNRLEGFVQEAETLENEEILKQKDVLLNEIAEAPLLTKSDKQSLEKILQPLRDVIAGNKEKALMAMPEGDRQALETLRSMLQQRLERRQEIKEQLEQYRKSAGSSGLDFEKAIAYKELIAKQKEQMEKVNERIKELQDKVKVIESTI